MISAIIPAYNKEQVIEKALEGICKELKKTKMKFEMIIVNDGSSDKTREKIVKFCRAHREAKLLDLQKNVGKGLALREGFKTSNGELVFFIDADGDLSPNQVHLFLRYMNKYNVDVVIGSKNHPDSVVEYPLTRKILSRIYQILCFALFHLPVSDTQVGLKLFRRSVLEFAMPRMLVKKFAHAVELLVLANAKGFHIKEAPVEIKSLVFVKSSVNIRPIIDMFVDTMAIWYRIKLSKNKSK